MFSFWDLGSTFGQLFTSSGRFSHFQNSTAQAQDSKGTVFDSAAQAHGIRDLFYMVAIILYIGSPIK